MQKKNNRNKSDLSASFYTVDQQETEVCQCQTPDWSYIFLQ